MPETGTTFRILFSTSRGVCYVVPKMFCMIPPGNIIKAGIQYAVPIISQTCCVQNPDKSLKSCNSLFPSTRASAHRQKHPARMPRTKTQTAIQSSPAHVRQKHTHLHTAQLSKTETSRRSTPHIPPTANQATTD